MEHHYTFLGRIFCKWLRLHLAKDYDPYYYECVLCGVLIPKERQQHT